MFVLVFLLIGLFSAGNNEVYDNSCVQHRSEKIINGNSLSGIFESGDCVKVLYGFYGCNQVKREDIVVYDQTGSKNPIIKIVKAVPGDKLFFRNGDSKLIINGKPVANSKGDGYSFAETKMLELYANDYPIIPKDTYLILGNNPHGTFDSSHFGLVDGEDIIGKAIACY